MDAQGVFLESVRDPNEPSVKGVELDSRQGEKES
jgi:hypothetical protein